MSATDEDAPAPACFDDLDGAAKISQNRKVSSPAADTT
eukprot:CAMPEP_0198125952 /NCGR_PEP_ID=MMETSP1442-20131203/43693_1 /TAXON_ID= /ORGANISM="Craspedostauros australis, Strain CCMP3328" /LENGTH=37 /DNA_ID= /DNA_START= /DNA_END= /DNA_ORIENTATION=